jgi:hypothetical protein
MARIKEPSKNFLELRELIRSVYVEEDAGITRIDAH